MPFVANGLHCAASAELEPVCQLLQVSSIDLGQQGLGELGLILPAYHKVLVLKMTHILIPQILHSLRQILACQTTCRVIRSVA